MWSRFKYWLKTPDEYDSVTGYNAICMFFWNLLAWGIPLTFIVLEAKGII